jgi:hypothetical protein
MPHFIHLAVMEFYPVFILNVAGIFLAFGELTRVYIWPSVRKLPRHEALKILALPHAFRFIGLSFLFPGVVSPLLSSAILRSRGMGRLWRRGLGSSFHRSTDKALAICCPACLAL